MVSYLIRTLTALNLDLCVSSANIRDFLVLAIALAAVIVVGGPYTPDISYDFPSPPTSTSIDSPLLTNPVFTPGSSLIFDDLDLVALDMAPFPANQDGSLWLADGEYNTGLGLTFKDPEIIRRMNMVALHTIVYDMDPNFFDFACRAGHVESIGFEDLLGDSGREFGWSVGYGDDSWLFDRVLYEGGFVEVEEEREAWERFLSFLLYLVLWLYWAWLVWLVDTRQI
ncbi:hypothetical protein PQX77_019996 [Marasmius sp. AFHP31]|nr:hypothetical protein PQX77_019996 [Marasmius sp. AFHP31]